MLKAVHWLIPIWSQATAASDDYAHNNIRHQFESVKQLPALQPIFRLLTLLLPDSLWTFSAAKYCRAGHIVPHDAISNAISNAIRAAVPRRVAAARRAAARRAAARWRSF